ncbi:MAG TPA: NUDIX hydrolase [Egibacteraceae bacterium]|nr:NUDIX hydrolase [Egibacteraceae bacterium]
MDLVRAAGGVLWRRSEPGGVEVAVIHRPRHDDWTLPKGKLEPGEGELEAALREVREETGYQARPGRCLGEIAYRHSSRGRRRTKVVRFWAMEVAEGGFRPGTEVDELRWLAPGDAGRLLSHEHERDVLRRFLRVAA